MNALLAHDTPYLPASHALSSGTTSHARKLAHWLHDVTEHARDHASDWRTATRNSIEWIALENSFEGWNGYGAKPISQRSKQFAQQFIEMLPSHMPAPEPLPDPDGEIALCWDYGPDYIFTISFSPKGILSYAGLIGQEVKRHGVEPFRNTVPKVIFDTLEELRIRACAAG